MNKFEKIWSCWSVSKFKIIKWFFSDGKLVTLIEVFNGDLIKNCCSLVISIFEKNLSLHYFFIKFVDSFFVLYSFCTLGKFSLTDSSLCQSLRNLAAVKALEQWLCIEQISFQKIKFRSNSLRILEVSIVSVVDLDCAFFQVFDSFNFKENLLKLFF